MPPEDFISDATFLCLLRLFIGNRIHLNKPKSTLCVLTAQAGWRGEKAGWRGERDFVLSNKKNPAYPSPTRNKHAYSLELT